MAGRAPLCPVRLEPIFSARPWGARNLAPLFPQKSNLAEPLGEAWLTGNECHLASGPFAGKKLGDVWPAMTSEWTGTQIDSQRAAFPLLVKFIFAQEKLSVQVHPDDSYAEKHEAPAGGRGKTEMWYVVNAHRGAEVLVGLNPAVTPDTFKQAIANQTVEDCLQHIPLRPGDAMFVPAGTAHTIGAGLVLCEIQQNSDLTYRVYDYNRRDSAGKSRELHLEKAFEVIRFGKQHGGKVDPVSLDRGGVKKTFFAACRYFATERWQFSSPASASTSPEHFELIIILDGAGSIRWSNESTQFSPAQAWLIPAGLGAFEVAPQSNTAILRTYVPRDLAAVAESLIQQGVSAADISRVVFA